MLFLPELIFKIISTLIIFLPGIFLCYLLYPKLNIIQRVTYSVLLSVSIFIILGLILVFSGDQNLSLIFLFLLIVSIFLWILISRKNSLTKIKTEYDRNFLYLVTFSFVGVVWKKLFFRNISNPTDSYGFAFDFIGSTEIPDLGFYTGLAVDRVNYIGLTIGQKILDASVLNVLIIKDFITILVFISLIYIIFKLFDRPKMALFASFIMALGPLELFYSVNSVVGHSLSYFLLLCLFIYFKTKDNNFFWLVFLLVIATSFSYYTGSVVTLIGSGGFLAALLIKDFIKNKNLKLGIKSVFENKKYLGFILIILIILGNIFIYSNMDKYSVGMFKDRTNIDVGFENIKDSLSKKGNSYSDPSNPSNPSNPSRDVSVVYRDPTFFGLSAIRWQMLFFFFSGLTFITHLFFKRRFTSSSLDLFLCLIPVLLISLGFIYTNFPTRVFNYFAFFGLLTLTLPNKLYKKFFVAAIIFVISSGYFVIQDKKIFFEISEKEMSGAEYVAENFDGVIFSDLTFVNLLTRFNYYNVTGADDTDNLVYNLFYTSDKESFIDAINFLANSSVDYLVINKRMIDKYVLMLNYPKKPIANLDFHKNFLEKVWHNDDVRVYKIPASN